MKAQKRKALLDKLVGLANEGRFFVSMETNQTFFLDLAPATPRVCVGVLLRGDSTRPTVTAGPMISDQGFPNNGSVIYRKLTEKEKDHICTTLGDIANEVGVRFKLLKPATQYSDGLLYYRFS